MNRANKKRNYDAYSNEHPVVRTHPETGKKILFVNWTYTKKIIGLEKEESDEILNKIWDPIMFFSNIQLDESEWDWYTENIDWIEYYVDNKTWAKTKIMSSEEAKEVNKVLTSEKKLSSDEYIELNTKIQILEQQISNKTFVLNENIFSPLIFIIALSIINILWFIYIYFRMKK